MKRLFQAGLLLAVACVFAPQAYAADRDRDFFSQAEGMWTGPGEVVAGKFKGTKFVCNFSGTTPAKKAGMTLDGGCRVGVFNQKMSATVERYGNGYKGKFLDGAAGNGMDIVSGNVVGNNKAVFGINRKKLNGAMIAKMGDDGTMLVTVSVKVEDRMIPVLGMNLKRVDSVATEALAE